MHNMPAMVLYNKKGEDEGWRVARKMIVRLVER